MFHRRKNYRKFTFTFDVRKISNIKTMNGKAVYLTWRRGLQKKSGSLKRVLAKNNEATWNSSFSFSSKFITKDLRTFQAKDLILTVNAVRKTTPILVGRLSLNLCDYLNKSVHYENLEFEEGECSTATLDVVVTVTLQIECFDVGIEGLTSEMTLETEFENENGEMLNIDELFVRREELAQQFNSNETIIQRYEQEIIDLEEELDNMEEQNPLPSADLLDPISYSFLIDDVLIHSKLTFTDNKPTMSSIIFTKLTQFGSFQTNDTPLVSQLFAIINGTIHLSSGSPSKLCYWLSTMLDLYAKLYIEKKTIQMEKEVTMMFTHMVEQTIASTLTTIIDYGISKTEPYLNDLFFNSKTRLSTEKVFYPIDQTIKELTENKIDTIFVTEYVNFFLRYLDRYLFIHFCSLKAVSMELSLNISMRSAQVKAIFPSITQTPDSFSIMGDVSKVLLLNLDSFPPNEIFTNIAPHVNPATLLEILKRFEPPLKKTRIEQFQNTLPKNKQVVDLDPYAPVTIDKSTLELFLFKQN
ncbi:C2 NT-type domain-containing protein [Entamoeba marina]